MECNRRGGIISGVECREERIELCVRHGPAEPAKAGEEHELELVDDGPRDAQEQIVEATVLEVILDARPADPTDAAIDDQQLAVIEVSERVQGPAHRLPCVDRARLRAQLGGPHDAHCDASGRQLLIHPL